MLTEGQIGWLAGIIDGEGTIAFYLTHGGRSVTMKLAMGVTSKRMRDQFVDYCTSITGQRVGTTVAPAKLNKKTRYDAAISPRIGMLDVLTTVLPYLTTKRAEAELAIDYWTWRKTRPWRRLSPDDKACQQMMCDKMKALKKEA
jgi:hypothetical protein